MTKARSTRFGAVLAACAAILAASFAAADQTGGGSLRGRGPGCPDHKACFEGFAAKQRGVRTIVSGFRETRTVPGRPPVVSSGQFSWKSPGSPTWKFDRSDKAAGSAEQPLFVELGMIFTSTDQFVGSRFDMVAGSGGPQTVHLVPRNKGASETIEGVDLDVDPSTGLVRSATVREKDGTTTRVELVEAAVDPPDPVR